MDIKEIQKEYEEIKAKHTLNQADWERLFALEAILMKAELVKPVFYSED